MSFKLFSCRRYDDVFGGFICYNVLIGEDFSILADDHTGSASYLLCDTFVSFIEKSRRITSIGLEVFGDDDADDRRRDRLGDFVYTSLEILEGEFRIQNSEFRMCLFSLSDEMDRDQRYEKGGDDRYENVLHK